MTGALLDVFVPFPSFPKSLLPQQYAVPSWVTPQVLLSPMSTEMKVWPPTTGSGVKCARVKAIDLEVLEKLAKALEVDASYLIVTKGR